MERMLSVCRGMSGFQRKKAVVSETRAFHFKIRETIQNAFHEVKCHVSCRLEAERYTWMKGTVEKIAELQRGTTACAFL